MRGLRTLRDLYVELHVNTCPDTRLAHYCIQAACSASRGSEEASTSKAALIPSVKFDVEKLQAGGYKLKKLQTLCKKHGLPANGTASKLTDRLLYYYNTQPGVFKPGTCARFNYWLDHRFVSRTSGDALGAADDALLCLELAMRESDDALEALMVTIQAVEQMDVDSDSQRESVLREANSLLMTHIENWLPEEEGDSKVELVDIVNLEAAFERTSLVEEAMMKVVE
ncbi:hypothetical protein CYMTET_22371 [Cymbomonas tetramitiformis]|uniref:SAP domain-containing protein n=1 Tax=Cymbomonas tetramitiformis TaxID=36881 RepID=A0AAE0G0C5_9CHLO|nr:hypothetical protein CYMTET_22371 [Cymbomonas tetramitiformis]